MGRKRPNELIHEYSNCVMFVEVQLQGDPTNESACEMFSESQVQFTKVF